MVEVIICPGVTSNEKRLPPEGQQRRKEADFQHVLYYKKATIKLFNWEPQMNHD